MWLKSALLFLRSTASSKFWKKVTVLEGVKQLYFFMDPTTLLLPRHVYRHDMETNAGLDA
jgi:hypothetical protein